MRKSFLILLTVITLALPPQLLLALTPSVDTATASVSVTVDNIMEWSGNFTTGISLTNIAAQGTSVNGSDATTLYTNGDVTLTADLTAQLTESGAGTDTLVTQYKLEFDGNGTTATGASNTSYALHSAFLSGGKTVTHYAEDGAVSITLFAQASNDSGNVADANDYAATQTLTATWAGGA